MTYWKDSLLIGVPAIDSQHRELIRAIDELMEACNKGQGRAAIEKTLGFVVSYTRKHFADEEALQAKYRYPETNRHRQAHQIFIGDISGLVQEFERDGPSITLTGKLNKQLVNWLIHHISEEDQKLGAHIQATDRK